MSCSRDLISPLLLTAFAAGCSSMSDSVATLEARGGLVGESQSYDEWPSGYSGSNGPGPWIEGAGNVAWRSHGLRGSLNTPEVDVICGVGRRRIEGRGITEVSLGLRKRFFRPRNWTSERRDLGQRQAGGPDTRLGPILLPGTGDWMDYPRKQWPDVRQPLEARGW